MMDCTNDANGSFALVNGFSLSRLIASRIRSSLRRCFCAASRASFFMAQLCSKTIELTISRYGVRFSVLNSMTKKRFEGELNSIDPARLIKDSHNPIDNFFLTLAVIYNDLK